MHEDKVIPLKNPGTPAPVADALTELLREGAQRMLAAAIEAEVAAFLERFKDEKTADGRQRVVRNGHLPTRSVQTGVGAVEVMVSRVRDRAKTIRFTSAILPPYLRRTKSLEDLLPGLYLKGVSTGDFQDALTALLGPGGARAIGEHHQPREGDVEGRTSPRVAAGCVDSALCVSPGGWQPFRGTVGGGGAVHSDGDGGYGGRHEGVAGVGRRLSGKRTVLA